MPARAYPPQKEPGGAHGKAAGAAEEIPDISVPCRALDVKTAEAAVNVTLELYDQDSMQLSDRDDLLLIAQEALDSIDIWLAGKSC